MKILWNNLLKTATVTADKNDSRYPVSNIFDRFLTRVYRPISESCEIDIDLGANTDISCIAIGYTNVKAEAVSDTYTLSQSASEVKTLDQSASEVKTLTQFKGARYTLKTSAGAVVGSGILELDYETNMTYFDSVSARYIELEFFANEEIYIGGVGAGVPFFSKFIGANPIFGRPLRGNASKTTGGFSLGRNYKSLRTATVTMPVADNDERKELGDMIDEVGGTQPIYFDVYDGDHTIEPPMYSTIIEFPDVTKITRNKDRFTPSISVEEAR